MYSGQDALEEIAGIATADSLKVVVRAWRMTRAPIIMSLWRLASDNGE